MWLGEMRAHVPWPLTTTTTTVQVLVPENDQHDTTSANADRTFIRGQNSGSSSSQSETLKRMSSDVSGWFAGIYNLSAFTVLCASELFWHYLQRRRAIKQLCIRRSIMLLDNEGISLARYSDESSYQSVIKTSSRYRLFIEIYREFYFLPNRMSYGT